MPARTARLSRRLLTDERLSDYTTWGIGGVADQIYLPLDIEDLAGFIRTLPPEQPVLWIGRGSNLLVRDGGFRGTVIALVEGLEHVRELPDGLISAEAGTSLARLSRFSSRLGWRELDFLVGIPGSVGGALAMNAGAFGGEIWEWVDSVEVMNRKGVRLQRSVDEYRIGYRSVELIESGGDEEWFVSATFRRGGRSPRDRREDGIGAGESSLPAQLKKRNECQPMGLPSCGSVFRNPQGDFAGRLIEQSGLKGYCIGGACVSEQHANFIVHRGGATAEEIEQLIHHIERVVAERDGVQLQREVRIVGEPIEAGRSS